MFRLRRGNDVHTTLDDWKVTATYAFRLTARRQVQGVRISCYGARIDAVQPPKTILHLSMGELKRLFRPRTRGEWKDIMRDVERHMRVHFREAEKRGTR